LGKLLATGAGFGAMRGLTQEALIKASDWARNRKTPGDGQPPAGDFGETIAVKEVAKDLAFKDNAKVKAYYAAKGLTPATTLIGAAAAGADFGFAWAQTWAMQKLGDCHFDCNEGMVASPTNNYALKSIGKIWGCFERGTDTWVATTANEAPKGAKSGQ